MSQQYYVVLLREHGKKWASAYGLFQSTQDARDYIENNLGQNTQYKTGISEATDDEIDKALEIRMKSNKSFLGTELLALRERPY